MQSTNRDNTDYPPRAAAWSTLAILGLTFMVSYLDRSILILLVEPVKQELLLSDTQIGLLTGLAFAVMYALAGVPMGRIADLWVRKYVIIIGVSIWSTLTMLSGFAQNYPQLFLSRMGVGFGEAALTPTAYATIPDLFPPEKLARAMSIFVLCGLVGGGLAGIFGGLIIGAVESMDLTGLPLIGDLSSWRIVLLVTGGLSLLIIIPLWLMPEPKRHGPAKWQEEKKPADKQSFKDVLDYLWDRKAFYGNALAAGSTYNLYGFGAAIWVPAYFIRIHGWEPAQVGITLGSLVLTPAIVGALCSGWLADYFYGKGFQIAPLFIKFSALLLFAPLILFFIYFPVMELKLAAIVIFVFLESMYSALFPTVLQMATPNRFRAQASAMYLMVANFVGMGLGALLIGLITDYGFRDEMAIGHSIAIVGTTASIVSAIFLFSSLKPFKRQVIEVIGDNKENNAESNWETLSATAVKTDTLKPIEQGNS